MSNCCGLKDGGCLERLAEQNILAIGRHWIESRVWQRQISILKRPLWLQNRKVERRGRANSTETRDDRVE